MTDKDVQLGIERQTEVHEQSNVYEQQVSIEPSYIFSNLYLNHLLTRDKPEAALSIGAVVVALCDVQLVDHRLVESALRELILGDDSRCVTD